jgi:hypothetical protein
MVPIPLPIIPMTCFPAQSIFLTTFRWVSDGQGQPSQSITCSLRKPNFRKFPRTSAYFRVLPLYGLLVKASERPVRTVKSVSARFSIGTCYRSIRSN